MKFTNLRLVGFKSFVDAVDFDIRDGLTGVVGPNGCGKSNLLEALRWVMGATSAKALRGGGMADVIFAGTTMRPSRNWAEVVLTLDNADRSAPPEFNDADVLEVSRRIIRNAEGAHSVYRINAKEVRAKDVQLLFADAATGANSPALVRQGQISELINAKPQNRRRLLEEAAGVTGLHSRRHEAELRLRAAEQNLERLDDVAGELDAQKVALARQARQATRYRNLSGDIRRAEAASAYLRWRAAVDSLQDAATGLAEADAAIETATRAAAVASTRRTDLHEKVEPLRQAETEAAAALQRLNIEREKLDDEAKRAAADLARLAADGERLAADQERERALGDEAHETLETLASEARGLAERDAAERPRIAAAAARRESADGALVAAEGTFERKNTDCAAAEAERRAADAAFATADARVSRLDQDIESLIDERARIEPSAEESAALKTAADALAGAEATLESAAHALETRERERAETEEKERAARAPLDAAEKSLTALSAERDALAQLLRTATAHDGEAHGPTLLDAVEVKPGYENALAAAFGDDIDAALSAAAPTHWTEEENDGGERAADGAPEDAHPLANYVAAPPHARRRLSLTGVVDRAQGDALASDLKPGQRLVSRDGDLWRWDGFVRRAEAKTPAAVRLEQRNRLSALEVDLGEAEALAASTRAQHQRAEEALNAAAEAEKAARTKAADARRDHDSARKAMSELERAHERASRRLAAIADALQRLTADKEAAETERRAAGERRDALPDQTRLIEGLTEARDALSAAKAEANDARAALDEMRREAAMRESRAGDVERECGVWRTRQETAAARIEELAGRMAEINAAREMAAAAPAAIEERRVRLIDQFDVAEARRNAAADALAAAVGEAEAADRDAKSADNAAAEAREVRARLDAQAEAAGARVEEATALARETCEAAPEDLPAIAEIKDLDNPPDRASIDAKLERYKRERENLGGVNLRADEELTEITARLEEIGAEREDCEAAIRKLRASIGGLNREARERLNAAFETVNANFSTLFTRLFNGGQAELRLIDSEDVLEAGLEIFASPPGKKLASMSLMSGGEQALTATALIFGVFIANPAPVCVLDEVDAPLDDANVERFCRLLSEMARETGTRFIVITHHALTMSRMDRLFGVTMIERGVSQLVSVDLSNAEQLAAAE